ncbi:LysR family substrate-binding domain-containing protein [Paracoccus cavernae]|uniref:LysR family substrate-binding domain-containing protein n=1 Tax=Paracoccus cavernae TaxID=1571207 RepID=UPI0036337987
MRLAYMAFAATELMPSAVARFRRLHPHIEVSLSYIRTQGQKLALANDEIDAGYMIGPFTHPDFQTLALTQERLYVVTPRNHAVLRRSVITPADLADLPVILGDMKEWGEYRWRLANLFIEEGIALNVTVEASNTLALIGLVAAGLGVTIYPESLIGFIGRSVEVRPIIHPKFKSETVLAWRRSNQGKQLRAFIDVARNLAPSASA